MPGAVLRLVTVDITNTMIRVAASPGKLYAQRAVKHGICANEEALTYSFLRTYKEYCGKYPNFGANCEMSPYKWWTQLVVDTFVSAGVKKSPELPEIAKELFYFYSRGEAWRCLPDAVAALQDLQKFNVKMGVISNWDPRLYKVLTELDLRKYFDFVLPSYVVGAEKPDPLIFKRALADAGVKAEQAVHFGDNIEKDFIGARNAGMMAYLLESKGVNHDFLDAKFVVKTVGDFVKAIAPLMQLRATAST